MHFFRSISLLLLFMAVSSTLYAKQRMTPNGTIVNYTTSKTNEDIYKFFRIVETITDRYIPNVQQTRVVVEVNDSTPTFEIKLLEPQRIIILLNEDFPCWKADQQTVETILRSIIVAKLETPINTDTIPYWFVSGIRQAGFRKAHYIEIIKQKPFPILRTLLEQGIVPDLELILSLYTPLKNDHLKKIQDEVSALLFASLPTSAYAPYLTPQKEQDAASLTTPILNSLGIENNTQLESWFASIVIRRTMNSANPAPSAFVKKKFFQIEQIHYTIKEQSETSKEQSDTSSSESDTPKAQNLSAKIFELTDDDIEKLTEQQFASIGHMFFREMSQLVMISQREIGEHLSLILELHEEYEYDDFEDFVEEYLEQRDELIKTFEFLDKTDQLLVKAESAEHVQKQKGITFLQQQHEQKLYQPLWPALDNYLNQIELQLAE